MGSNKDYISNLTKTTIGKSQPLGPSSPKCETSEAEAMFGTLVNGLMFMATALFLNDTEIPLKGHPVTLDETKFIRNAINDVALGVARAGLSRYLNRRYGWSNENGYEATRGKIKL
ncbi:hypothetical protein SADUNF_Sadunf14G0069700 [Salix dunnii]|uniref:Uncharacterized protein n=1 Tax=Salix dunnii TaxID=1413687 RepID=A0A835JG57_9ROSI|nr:hypothetical protein SADUNF_Sadunf14G0069700 [Salix dunnii]